MNNGDSRMEFYRQIFGGAWITQGIGVAAELGIADLIADGPKTVEELAKETNTHAGALYRVLRALAGMDIFSEDLEGRFSMTPLAELLRSDGLASQRALAEMMSSEFHVVWGKLIHTVRTGEPGFHQAFGASFFHYMQEHPERHSIYDSAMTGVHGGETEPMLDAYNFGAFDTIVDIGGGNGLMLTAILERHPDVQGILFDLPAVADRARSSILASGVADRIRVEGGDFFESVPAGADAYVLRHIIHDWENPEAIAILRRCREAMAPNGKILVVETVLPPGNEPSFGKWLDLMMLLVAGRERTQQEYSRLFSESGLKMNQIFPTSSEVSVVEAVQAECVEDVFSRSGVSDRVTVAV